MIVWCAYCQRYQGEIPPYENFALSHGVCSVCETRGLDLSKEVFEQILALKKIQEALLQAGQDQDFRAADDAVNAAEQAGARPVDILMGLIAPLLWNIGERWSRGEITVAEEHKLTSFYNATIARLEEIQNKSFANDTKVDLLLLNASGNVHLLGVRVLSLWLQSEGIRTSVIPGRYSVDSVVSFINERAPGFLGISVALAEHLPAAVRLAHDLNARLPSKCPKILIGGNAVKTGTVADSKILTPVLDPKTVIEIIRAQRVC